MPLNTQEAARARQGGVVAEIHGVKIYMDPGSGRWYLRNGRQVNPASGRTVEEDPITEDGGSSGTVYAGAYGGYVAPNQAVPFDPRTGQARPPMSNQDMAEQRGGVAAPGSLGTSGSVPGQRETQATQQQSTAAHDAQRAELRARKVWIDGQYVTVNEQADGSWVTAPVGNLAGEQTTVPRLTAFDALDGGAVSGDEPFLMSQAHLVQAQRGQYGSADAADRATTKAGAQGYLSIRGGIAWLAELSTKDNAAYRAMLDKLVNAGYLTAEQRTAAGGQWSTPVGNALANAARELSVVNTTDLGKNTTLDQWLVQKAEAGAGADAGGTDNQPVTREYTDPEQLKAAAKSAAEDALGRKLSDAEEAELVGHFRALEDGMFDQIDAARAGSTGGGSYVNPSPTGQIGAFLDSGPREQEQANWSTAGYGEALLRLFGVSV